MNENLKSAIANLAIFNISLRSSMIESGEGYNMLNINATTKKPQSFRTIVKIEAIELVKPDDGSTKLFYSFHYNVGSRLIESSPKEPTESDEDNDEDDVIVTIEANFEAIYRAKKELSQEELEAFAAQNVGYNVWPYWREYLQGTCSRMGISPIKVPFYRFNESDIPTSKE
ncbi:hypothetical protein BSU01_14435 [Erwinia billingiae]|uniref:hypothetical protein n=1 Tax=Erwinia billingiae TaxID=182337 RepID=UPI0019CFC43C|nr:hypothetical protein [Erwinia billingiae]MBN7122898.1 hypothetical protein [Erwinia billingiae]